MKEKTPRKKVVQIATKKKYKKLTNKEKQLNKEFREEMRERGILPPVKPKLNRRKFAQEVREEWEKRRFFVLSTYSPWLHDTKRRI